MVKTRRKHEFFEAPDWKIRSYKRNVPKEVKAVISDASEKVTARHASALVKLRKYSDKQRQLAERIVTENLDGATAEREANLCMMHGNGNRGP